MRCVNCGVCCTETEMLLSQRDISRLVKKGFDENFFAKRDEHGYAILRNRDGYCVFYDQKHRRCSVYADRPSGCRIYPVVFDEEKGVVLDGLCPCINSVDQGEKSWKGKRVIKLLERIDTEAAKRSSRSGS